MYPPRCTIHSNIFIFAVCSKNSWSLLKVVYLIVFNQLWTGTFAHTTVRA